MEMIEKEKQHQNIKAMINCKHTTDNIKIIVILFDIKHIRKRMFFTIFCLIICASIHKLSFAMTYDILTFSTRMVIF